MIKNQVKQLHNEQISFKAHYESKKQEVQKLREDICALIGCSSKTFYRKLENNTWSNAEQIVISQHIGIERDILFPNKTA